jgi:hypothetical protein
MEMSKKEKDHNYFLIYDVKPHPKGIKKTEVPKGMEACDAIAICSIIYEEEGLDTKWMLMDGREGAMLNPKDRFAVWALLVHALSEDRMLPRSQRALCHEVHETIKAAVLEAEFEEEQRRKSH